MESHGLLIGSVLLVIVTLAAWAIGARANAGVRRFREEHHESFLGRPRPGPRTKA